MKRRLVGFIIIGLIAVLMLSSLNCAGTASPSPTPTLTPTETPIPQPKADRPLAETKTPTPKPASPSATITPSTTPQPKADPSLTETPDEKLSIQAFDPPFIWADYATVGPKEAIITGTGFTNKTIFELYGPHDPYEKISSKDIVYPVTVVSVLSSHQVKVKIPVGLYNAHYSLKVTDPDKNTYVERDSILVVSGDTSTNH